MKSFMIVILAALVIGCSHDEKPATKRGVLQPVRVAKVESRSGIVEIAGTVRAGDVAEMASRIGGYVRTVSVQAGDRVKRGDPLVLVDEGGLQAQGKRIRASEGEAQQAIEEARNHVQAANAQRELASNTFARIRSLYDKKAASRQEYEEATSKTEGARAAWEAAQRRLEQASSRLEQVRAEQNELTSTLSYQRITAPFDGVVSSVPANTGTFVQPGQTVVVVEDQKVFHVHFAVEQELINRSTSTIAVRFPQLADKPLEARVVEVSPAADQDTRTYRIKALLPSNSLLRSGMTGIVQLPAQEESLWIPADFLKQTNDIETVVVQQENEWRRVLVKSGIRSNGFVEILSGLSAGEQVGLMEETR